MRFVFKVGTSLLTTGTGEASAKQDGTLNLNFLRDFTQQVADIHTQKHEVIIVTSGAVAAGRSEINFEHEKKNIPYRQALAAVGQGILMKTYHDFFLDRGITVAQALLTNYDFTNRENFLNSKNVIALLLKQGIIPIVNENDVTTIAELKFGDNDMLSAYTAAAVSADFLIIFTDVDGFFAKDPKTHPLAQLIPIIHAIDEEILAGAGEARSNASLGGMKTKLEAAKYVTSVGIPMLIVNGRKPFAAIRAVSFCQGKNSGTPYGTFFPTAISRLESQKKWLRPKIQKNAWIEVDDGASEAIISSGKSLLPGGIAKISGAFQRGDVIMIKNSKKNLGYGQVNYSAADIDKIKKHHSREIETLLSYSFEPEVIHRDRMVILD